MTIALQIIGGLLLLFFGGEFLVRGAVILARKMGVSTMVIGLTVVAFGTSSPEMLISAQAALSGHPDIALGNVIGSNISNILLVLGLSALVFPVMVNGKEAAREAWIGVAAVLLLFGVCGMGSEIVRWEAAVFLLLLLLYTWQTFRRARRERRTEGITEVEEVEESILPADPAFALVYVVGGIAGLVYGADLLVEGASALARTFGISEAVIGVTLVALGGSAPELATSVVAAFRKHSDIAMGNVLGSNLFNIFGVLGVAGVLHPIEVAPRFLTFDLVVLLFISVILSLAAAGLHGVPRWLGAIFAVGYGGYVAIQFLNF